MSTIEPQDPNGPGDPEPSVRAALDQTRTEVAPARGGSDAIEPGQRHEHGSTLDSPEDDRAGADSRPSDGSSSAPWSPERAREHLPTVPRERYEEGREIARGGLGRITSTRDHRLCRQVAIKELLDTPGANHRRFLREALITAGLQHPAIVPVYEAGYWPDGSPFYAMKLIEGRNLADRLKEARNLAERLAFLPNIITATDAIAYAHSRRVIHRDLKPANVLLGDYGETVVVDWGLAKDLNAHPRQAEPASDPYREGGEGLTVAGTVMGTPGYMAPEQAQSPDVDERADVYALGAMVYYALTGEPPYHGSSPDEILDKISREEPEPLAVKVPDAPPDLVAIADKAMARDPAARYQSARELAEDLRRFENGQRVSVRDYTAYDVLSRWVKRHRPLVAVVVAALVVLAVVAAISVHRVIWARDLAEARLVEARRARAEAQAHADELTVAQANMTPDPTAAIAWLKTLPDTSEAWIPARMVAAEVANRGIARHVWRALVPVIAVSPTGDTLAWSSENGTIRIRQVESGAMRALRMHTSLVFDLQFAPDGQRLVSADRDGQIVVWSRDGDQIYRHDNRRMDPAGGKPTAVYKARFSPDGALVAASDHRGAVWLHDPAAGRARVLVRHDARVIALAWSPDGTLVASGDEGGSLRVTSVSRASGSGPGTPSVRGVRAAVVTDPPRGAAGGEDPAGASSLLAGHVGAIYGLVFDADGQRLVSSGKDGNVRVWRIADRTLERVLSHPAQVFEVAFAPAAGSLATASADGVVRLWPLDGERGGDAALALGSHDGHQCNGLAVSPNGELLASFGDDGAVRLWNLTTRREVRTYVGERDGVMQVVFSPDGARMWSAAHATGVREWSLADTTRLYLPGPQGWVSALALVPDGSFLAVGYTTREAPRGHVALWELPDGRYRRIASVATGVTSMAFSPDGARLAFGSRGGEVWVHERATGVNLRLGSGGADAHGGRVTGLAFLSDSRTLVTAADDGTAAVWTADASAGGALMKRLQGHEGPIQTLSISSDGAVTTAGDDGAIRVWDLASGNSRVLGRHDARIWRVAYTPDGRTLAAADAGGEVRLWPADGVGNDIAGESASGARSLGRQEHPVNRIVWSPGGERLAASGDTSSHVMVWDVNTGARRRLPVEGARALAWSPDGRRVATVSEDAGVRVWDLATGRGHPIARLSVPAEQVIAAGTRFIVGDRSGAVTIWRDDLPTDRAGLFRWLEDATSATIAPGALLASPLVGEPEAPSR